MLHIVDNYQGRKVYNEYDIVEFKELLANGIIFGEGYIYLNYNTMIFSDISENSPFYEAIKWCKDNGVTKGYEDGSFKPNQPITRGEMAQMLFNASKIK